MDLLFHQLFHPRVGKIFSGLGVVLGGLSEGKTESKLLLLSHAKKHSIKTQKNTDETQNIDMQIRIKRKEMDKN